MHPLYLQAEAITQTVIGAAMEVHRDKGPGLLESIYERCFIHELKLRGLSVEQQRQVQIRYKDLVFEDSLRCDVIVNRCVLVELKSVVDVLPIHKAQGLSYMKLLDLPLGFVINFNVQMLKQGVHRLMLPGANQPE
ncbi:MAG: GxxExxY protein [Prosthecobacter sp.]|uniref:GxxExxY protein n=1 Tax=Prosthecobacter sp. TaxID=1965333 RepID=UPI003901A89B